MIGDTLRDQPHDHQQRPYHDEPRRQPAVHPHFQDLPASSAFPLLLSFPPDELEYHRRIQPRGGTSNPGYFNTLDYSGAEDLTIIQGKHQIQLGAQYIRAYMHAQNTRGVNGNLNFTGQYTTVGGTTGLGYADLFTGGSTTLARAGRFTTTTSRTTTDSTFRTRGAWVRT